MKKLIMLLMAFCLIAPAAMADLSKDDKKAVEKMAKNKMKEFKKRGYEIMGADPMETALQKHFSQTNVNNATCSTQIGLGHAKSKNNGRQMCLNQAMTEYASKCMSQITGRTVTDSYGNQVPMENNDEFDRFYAAYERLTQGEIKGELQESFTVYKQNPDGTYDFEMYFTVNAERAAQARQRALANAAKESGLAQHYAAQISEFVKEPIAD